MPRVARVVVVGIPHHITPRGNNQQMVLSGDQDRRTYLRILKQLGHHTFVCGEAVRHETPLAQRAPSRRCSCLPMGAGTSSNHPEPVRRLR